MYHHCPIAMYEFYFGYIPISVQTHVLTWYTTHEKKIKANKNKNIKIKDKLKKILVCFIFLPVCGIFKPHLIP